MTVSRLAALTRAWQRTPPVAEQVARIGRFLGLPAASKTPAPNRRPMPSLSEQEQGFVAGLPSAPLPPYITAKQYLASKERARE